MPTWPVSVSYTHLDVYKRQLLTTDVVMDHKEKKEKVRSYINPELCEITEQLVYTEPYNDLEKRNNVFPPNQAFVEKELYGDKKLALEAAKLKFEFMTNAQSLIHGEDVYKRQPHERALHQVFLAPTPLVNGRVCSL